MLVIYGQVERKPRVTEHLLKPPLTFMVGGGFCRIMDECRDEARTVVHSSKGIPMNNITIGRYKPSQHLHTFNVELGGEVAQAAVDISYLLDGWIEGTRDDGSTWLMFLDASGNPTVFYARRAEDGGVQSEPIRLDGEQDGSRWMNRSLWPV